MAEKLIGRVSADWGHMLPDLVVAPGRTRETLDRQARLLERSGVGRVLGAIAELVPDTGFYYTDVAGVAGGTLEAGYILERSLPEQDRKVGIHILSDGAGLKVSRIDQIGKSASLHHDWRSDLSTTSSYNLLDYALRAGIIDLDIRYTAQKLIASETRG